MSRDCGDKESLILGVLLGARVVSTRGSRPMDADPLGLKGAVRATSTYFDLIRPGSGPGGGCGCLRVAYPLLTLRKAAEGYGSQCPPVPVEPVRRARRVG